MGDVQFSLNHNTKLSAEQIEMINTAKEKQDQLLEQERYDEVFDDDCPSTDEKLNPKLHAALLQAVKERNIRLAELAKKGA